MSDSKWKSQLFSEEKTENNKNILAFNMKNRIKKVKNKIDNIEPFETINEKREEEKEGGVDVDKDENVKEGMFSKGEFTGYDWDDPEHIGGLDNVGGGIADVIERVYQACIFVVNYTTDKVVKGSGKSGSKKDLKHNKKVVKKYVGLFYCLPLALFAAYNWYYITTFRSVLDNQRSVPGKYLTQRKKLDKNTGKMVYRGLSDDFIDKCEAGGFTGIIFNILYFFFEYTIKIFDEFNYTFLEYVPKKISENLGTTITFVFLFFVLLIILYFAAEVVKDMFISLLTGSGIGVLSGLLLGYVILKIGSTVFGSEPNKHFFSDWVWLGKTFASSGIFAFLILGFFLVINLLRAIVVGSLTLFWTPVIIGISILFYSFFSIAIFSDKYKKTIKEIDDECVKDYKVRVTSYCKPYTLWDWIVFIILTFCKFLYDSLLSSSYIAMLVTAIIDYNSNIKGGVKANLIAYSAAVLFLALAAWFNTLSKTLNENLKEAGLMEKPKEFKFDETDINMKGEDLIQKINKDVENLNKATVKNIF